jgi:molybdenum cofactor biosynthesis enzyme MoaA
MDERDGQLSALPCCANWIDRSYGPINDDTSLNDLWNGTGAQEIRQLMVDGRQDEICAPDCPWLVSGRFAEDALKVIPGPPEFEANQRLSNDEIRQRRTVLASLPMAIRVIPTLRCNIRCRMCHQDHLADLRLPEEFMADIRRMGPYIYDYQLHGGEVLISRRLSEWVDPEWLEANPQMLLSLITNGTRVPPTTWGVLRRARINYITVSINAATRETYRVMAEADLFDDVIVNTIALRDFGRTHDLQKFDVYVSFVIMRCNYREVPDFIRLANRLDVPFRLLLVVGNRMGESIYTDPPILRDVLSAVDEAAPLASERSRPEITRVQEALRETLATSGAPQENS